MPPQPGQTGLPSVSGQRRRKNTFTTPPSDMRMTFAALSERAAAESRKCCAMPSCRTKSVRPSCQREGASTRRITGEESRQWRQLHNAASVPVDDAGATWPATHGRAAFPALAHDLHAAMGRHHGTAAPAFVERLAELWAKRPEELAHFIGVMRDRFAGRLSSDADPQVRE